MVVRGLGRLEVGGETTGVTEKRLWWPGVSQGIKDPDRGKRKKGFRMGFLWVKKNKNEKGMKRMTSGGGGEKTTFFRGAGIYKVVGEAYV